MNHYIETDERWISVIDARSNFHTERRETFKAMPNQRAQLAMEMVKRWGIVAAHPDGEDTAGRSRLQLVPPRDVVDRAIATADLLMAAIEEAGWMDRMPHPQDVYGDGTDDDT